MFRFTFHAYDIDKEGPGAGFQYGGKLSSEISFNAETIEPVIDHFNDFLKSCGYNPGKIMETDDDGKSIDRRKMTGAEVADLFTRPLGCECSFCNR